MNPITVQIYGNSVSNVVTHFLDMYTTTSATAEAIFSLIHTFPNVRHPAGVHFILMDHCHQLWY